jgi:type I restriction enzyme M protein
MKPVDEGGSRVAIIMNGSPLFTGDAGSGESEIRRWILENDWLEALIALPEQLFYNTGIATYVWVLSNRKAPERKGLVQLIDTTSFWTQMRKSLGDKRREIPPARAEQILSLLRSFKEGEYVKIFPTTHFGFRKITVERPLRLNFRATPERIARLEEESAFRNLAVSKKKNPKEKAKEEAEGRKEQEAIRKMLATLPTTLFKDRTVFDAALEKAAKAAGLKLPAPVRKAILSALSERDETAEICRDSDGNPELDLELRDTENVPLSESIESYLEREVKPYVPDASINTAIRDEKDSQVGKIGYEINFNRYFYKYTPPRLLEKIEADIKQIEKDVLDMLREVAG